MFRPEFVRPKDPNPRKGTETKTICDPRRSCQSGPKDPNPRKGTETRY